MIEKKKDLALSKLDLPELEKTVDRLEQSTLGVTRPLTPAKLKTALNALEAFLNCDAAQVPQELVAEILAYYSPGKLVALEAIGGDGYVISYLDEADFKMILKIARPKKVGWEAPQKVGVVKGLFEEGREIKAKSIARERFKDGCRIQRELSEQAAIVGQADFVIPGSVFFSETPTLHTTMRFLDGIPLLRHIREEKSVLIALKLFCKVIKAVDFLHRRKILHRDLKPENLIWTHNNAIGLIDFHSAWRERNLTISGTAIGTKEYASPEQIEDAKTATERSDIFCLGGVFCSFILAIPLPRPLNLNLLNEEDKAQYVTDLESKLPPTFRAIFHNSANPNPDKRYQDCSHFLKAVEDKIKEIEVTTAGYEYGKTQKIKTEPKAEPKENLESRVEFLERQNEYLEKSIYDMQRLAEVPDSAETCPFLAYCELLKKKGIL